MKMIVAEEAHVMTLVNQLMILLDSQIVSAEKGQWEQVDHLMVSSSALAGKIVETKAFTCQAWLASRDEISQKYQRLELILASAKQTTKDELKHVKTTMKMLAVYRSSNR